MSWIDEEPIRTLIEDLGKTEAWLDNLVSNDDIDHDVARCGEPLLVLLAAIATHNNDWSDDEKDRMVYAFTDIVRRSLIAAYKIGKGDK